MPRFNYDHVDVVVVMVSPVCVTQQTIKLLRFNFNFRNLYYIVKHTQFCPYLESIDPTVKCVDENDVLPGVSYKELQAEGVSDNIKRGQGNNNRIGWYLQQYLKLGVALHLPGLSEHYLVWDADNIPIKPFQMFTDNGSPLFCANPSKKVSIAYSKFYMEVTGLELLHPERRGKYYNFVCGYMLFYKPYVREMLEHMDEHLIKHRKITTRKGFPWNLHEVADKTFSSGALLSEYDSYGSWVMMHHADQFHMDYSVTYTRNPGVSQLEDGNFVEMRCCLNHKRICDLGKEPYSTPHGLKSPGTGTRHHFLIWEEHKFRYRMQNDCSDKLPAPLEEAIGAVGHGMLAPRKRTPSRRELHHTHAQAHAHR